MLIINELWVKVFFRLSGINATAGTLPRLSDHVYFEIGSKQGTGTGTKKKGRPGSGEGPGPGPGRDHGPGSCTYHVPNGKAKKLPGTDRIGTPTPAKKIRFGNRAGCVKPGYNPDTVLI